MNENVFAHIFVASNNIENLDDTQNNISLLKWVNTNAYDHYAFAAIDDDESFYLNFNDFTGSKYRLKTSKS